MKILLVHNRYRQAGGEDAVFEAEKALLIEHGHEVREFVRDNREIESLGKFASAGSAIWSRRSHRAIQQSLSDFRPDVAHFHNTFMLVSPAAYYACREARVPVVQTLHNYRLLCPAATFLRDGRVCEECLGKIPPLPGIWHACWRGSRTQTAVAAAVYSIHYWLGTWQTQVDRYIALTEFARQKFIAAGLAAPKITVKPNFVARHPLAGPGAKRRGALFVGRLAPEKGIRTLLNAWRNAGDIPLQIVGDGPLREEAEAFVKQHNLKQIEFSGWLAREAVLQRMRAAQFLVFPSEWYEGFPLTLAEAFACATPVLASKLGGMAEIVTDGNTGLHVESGNAHAWTEKSIWAWTHPDEMQALGANAWHAYEEKYTAEKNHELLMDIYARAIAERGR
ncbi:MAG: D-inositol-3-phosphate glycosyltransferase [Anaerolineales bacterium]|nr:D-inositol-3-phosphate glycosyltransferase [Anaerolineales bacterium]